MDLLVDEKDVTRTGGQVRRAVRRIEQSVSDLSDHVAHVSDWLQFLSRNTSKRRPASR